MDKGVRVKGLTMSSSIPCAASVRCVASGIVACLALAGCGAPLIDLNWGGQPTEPVSAVVGHEQALDTIQSQEMVVRFPGDPEPAAPEPADPEVAQLDARIQQFAGRIPQTERDGSASLFPAGSPAASAGSPPAEVALQEPGGSGTSASRTGEMTAIIPGLSKPPSPASAGQEAPSTGPNMAVHVGTAASPLPPRAEAGSLTPTAQDLRIELIDIRPMTSTGSPAEGDNPPSANQAVNAPEPASSPESDLVSLIRSLEQAVADAPQQLADHFRLRLLYMATGQSERAGEPVEEMDPVQGRMLSAACRTMTAVYDTMREPEGEAASEALSAVDDLHRLLSERSPVIIPRVVLVTAVNSFGDYRAVSPARFAPGVPIHVYCYTEVANFRSEPTGDGRIRTSLAARLEVFDAAGGVVWQQAVGQIEDRTFTPRRDFFVPLEVRLPADLPEGDYALKVTIEDKLGATTDQQRLTFAVVR